MRRCKLQYFIQRLFSVSHLSSQNHSDKTLPFRNGRQPREEPAFPRYSVLGTCYSTLAGPLRQIRLRIRTLHESPQTRFHRRTGKQFTEQLDLLPQLLMRNRLDESLGRDRGSTIEFLQLGRRCSRRAPCLSFPHNLDMLARPCITFSRIQYVAQLMLS